MKHILPIIFTTVLSLFISCNQTAEQMDKEKILIEKENELLDIVNKLLTKEQEVNQKAQKQEETNQAVKHKVIENPNNDNIDFLNNMNGKYPFKVKFLENILIKRRLKKLLGNRFAFFVETWAVETPIIIENNIFVAWGCQQHNCGSTNFIIVVNLQKNVMYAGIREEGQIETYSEDENTLPKQLLEWVKTSRRDSSPTP